VLVSEHPDPAGAVIDLDSSTTPRVDGVRVDGVELPRLAFFAYATEVQLFWWPSDERWSAEQVDAFVALLRRFRERAPHVRLRLDPQYTDSFRRELADDLAALLGSDAVEPVGRR
jgi:hypothetical protein